MRAVKTACELCINMSPMCKLLENQQNAYFNSYAKKLIILFTNRRENQQRPSNTTLLPSPPLNGILMTARCSRPRDQMTKFQSGTWLWKRTIVSPAPPPTRRNRMCPLSYCSYTKARQTLRNYTGTPNCQGLF